MTDNKNYNDNIDTKLMLLVKEGDTEAMDRLYERNIDKVKRYFEQSGNVNGYSEDLAHDTFMRILEKRETFRENSTFKAFLNGYIRKILQEYKRELYKESKLAKKYSISQNQIESFTPEKACLYAEQIKNLEINKSKLSEKQRQAIELSLNPDFIPETAAKQTYCSNNTLRQRRFAARKNIKKLLK